MAAPAARTSTNWRRALAFYASIAFNLVLLLTASLLSNSAFLHTIVHVFGWPSAAVVRSLSRLAPEFPWVYVLIVCSIAFYFALFWAAPYLIARVQNTAGAPPSDRLDSTHVRR
jgi:hypothetical protein